MNFFFWNVRGLNNDVKDVFIREQIKHHSSSLIGFTETKLQDVSLARVSYLGGSSMFNYCTSIPSGSSSGGLVLIWDPEVFMLESNFRGIRWIILVGNLTKFDWKCAIGLVYGSYIVEEQVIIQNEINNVITSLDCPIMLMGDFNQVLSPRERKGQTIEKEGLRLFRDWVDSNCFIDLPLQGRKFTWSRGNSKSKIDRCLCSSDWLCQFPRISLIGLPYIINVSDHAPMKINIECSENWGAKPFRSLNAWFQSPSFKPLIKVEWSKTSHLPVHKRLKELKTPITSWNRFCFGDINQKLKRVQAAINIIECKGEDTDLSQEELSRLKALKVECNKWTTRKAQLMRQYSRVKNLSERDNNTKYFHAVATIHKKKNLIERIKINGRCLRGVAEIRKGVKEHFEHMYQQPPIPEIELPFGVFTKFNEETSAILDKQPDHDEIFRAMMSCDPSKAPGYDGFNMRFIREMWDVVGEDISQLILNFFASGEFPPSINTTWVTLIPKSEQAENISEFRPISVIGCIYKIIAKLIASRLKPVIGEIISETQTGFIENRYILDGVLTANESVVWMKNKRKKGALFKVDFKKAYDSLRWTFIEHMLTQVGIGPRMKKWIMWCITSASIFVMVNGSPTEPFKLQRGIRQGDPISSFIFTIVSEALNFVIRKAKELGLIDGLRIGSDQILVTHLQFADDTLLFIPQDSNVIRNYRRLLQCFGLMTGLEVNFDKSALIHWGVNKNWIDDMSLEIGCKVEKTPFKYLGLPIEDRANRVKCWDPILLKVRKRLAMWKSNLLSMAGRAQLIKSVLNNLPLYYLSMFKLPITVAKKLISIQLKFFWGSNESQNKLATIAWKELEAPKELGGLGFGSLILKNLGLLLKWWWRFGLDKASLWKRIVQSINRIPSNFLKPSDLPIFKQGPYADLHKASLQFTCFTACVDQSFELKLGNGDQISFWEDIWIQNCTLASKYPRLYALSLDKFQKIACMGEVQNNKWYWKFKWRRALFSREQVQVDELIASLPSFTPNSNRSDQIVWNQNLGQGYTCKAFVDSISPKLYQQRLDPKIINFIWKKRAPPRAQLLLWFLVRDSLKTGAFLVQRGILDSNQALCPFCGIELETSSHLFFTCKVTWQIWMKCMAWWKVMSPIHPSPSKMIMSWNSLVRGNFKVKMWSSLFFVITWSI